jgi:hypothetical protein
VIAQETAQVENDLSSGGHVVAVLTSRPGFARARVGERQWPLKIKQLRRRTHHRKLFCGSQVADGDKLLASPQIVPNAKLSAVAALSE